MSELFITIQHVWKNHTLTTVDGGHLQESVSVASVDTLLDSSVFRGTRSRTLSSTSSNMAVLSNVGIISRHVDKFLNASTATIERFIDCLISTMRSGGNWSSAKDLRSA